MVFHRNLINCTSVEIFFVLEETQNHDILVAKEEE